MSDPSPMLGSLVGHGEQAEVYAWGHGRVIKLFHPEYADRVDNEAATSSAVHAAGVRCPAVFGVASHGGRRGVVFERADGPTLRDQLLERQRSPKEVGTLLGELHVEMHRSSADLPPCPREYLGYPLAAGETVFHGDFHPGNVIVTARGPLIIDWASGCLAPRAADVAATFTSIRHHSLARAKDGKVDVSLAEIATTIAHTYLDAYRAGSPAPLDDFAQYLAVFAANTLHLYPDHPERSELEGIAAAGRRASSAQTRPSNI